MKIYENITCFMAINEIQFLLWYIKIFISYENLISVTIFTTCKMFFFMTLFMPQIISFMTIFPKIIQRGGTKVCYIRLYQRREGLTLYPLGWGLFGLHPWEHNLNWNITKRERKLKNVTYISLSDKCVSQTIVFFLCPIGKKH